MIGYYSFKSGEKPRKIQIQNWAQSASRTTKWDRAQSASKLPLINCLALEYLSIWRILGLGMRKILQCRLSMDYWLKREKGNNKRKMERKERHSVNLPWLWIKDSTCRYSTILLKEVRLYGLDFERVNQDVSSSQESRYMQFLHFVYVIKRSPICQIQKLTRKDYHLLPSFYWGHLIF